MHTPYKLYSITSGIQGSSVVFLPGLGGTTRYWQGRLSPIERVYRVVCLDPLGFGQSPKPWTQYTVDRHVSAIHQTLGEQGALSLVGHSMGAVLSLAYAARYPEQVERVVLIGLPYFGGKRQALKHFRNGAFPDRWFLTNIALAAIACILTRRVFGVMLPYIRRDMPREVAQDVVKHTWRSFTSSLWEVIYNHDPSQDADALDTRIPVHCIHGDRDSTAPVNGVCQLASGRNQWTVQVIPDADHHPFLHAPSECLQAIETALADEWKYTVYNHNNPDASYMRAASHLLPRPLRPI